MKKRYIQPQVKRLPLKIRTYMTEASTRRLNTSSSSDLTLGARGRQADGDDFDNDLDW